MKTLRVGAVALLVALGGCGGGSGAPQTATPQKTVGPQQVQLRQCETTGQNAPPCPASQAAA